MAVDQLLLLLLLLLAAEDLEFPGLARNVDSAAATVDRVAAASEEKRHLLVVSADRKV